MLYGHIETMEERVDHMLRARALQDETGGLPGVHSARVPSRQQSDAQAPGADGGGHAARPRGRAADARQLPHVKAFWIATGVEVAQMALWFGADDLDGTVQEERIYHMAGSSTPEAMTTSAIRRLIAPPAASRIERDTLYNVVSRAGREARGRRSVFRAVTYDRRSAGLRLCRRAFGSRSHDGRPMQLNVLTDYEREHIGERQPLPEQLSAAVGRRDGPPHRRGKADARLAAGDPRASLSARRGHQVRRLHRRLAEAVAHCRQPQRRRLHRLLRRALHGRERRHPRARRISR